MTATSAEARKQDRIACIGDLMFVIARPRRDLPARNRTQVVDHSESHLGGSVPNIARHLSRIGRDCRVIAVVGGCEKAQASLLLESWHVDSSGLVECGQKSNLLVAFVGEHAARSVFIRAKATAEALDTMAAELAAERVVLFGGSRDREIRSTVLALAEGAAPLLVFSPSYSVFDMAVNEIRRFWAAADVIALNAHEYRFVASLVKGARMKAAETCLVVTRAHRGASVRVGKVYHHIPSVSNVTEDVIGAGDAFLSGFIDAWLNDRDAARAGAAGAELAATFIRDRGA
jgi:sugar/nucleoside kinase (ribokinase family)